LIPKTHLTWKDLGDISFTTGVIPILSQISLPWQQGSSGVNFNDAVIVLNWPTSKNIP